MRKKVRPNQKHYPVFLRQQACRNICVRVHLRFEFVIILFYASEFTILCHPKVAHPAIYTKLLFVHLIWKSSFEQTLTYAPPSNTTTLSLHHPLCTPVRLNQDSLVYGQGDCLRDFEKKRWIWKTRPVHNAQYIRVANSKIGLKYSKMH